MTKKEIRQLIKLIIANKKSYYMHKFIPLSALNSIDTFSEAMKMHGPDYFSITNTIYYDTINNTSIDINNKNLSEIVNKIYDIKCNDISDYIIKAIISLKLEEVDTPFFTENIEHFNELKNEILKLKSIDNEQIERI